MKKILIVVHQPTSNTGLIGKILGAGGYTLDIRVTSQQDELPPTLDNHDAVVIFGGPMSANDSETLPFIRAELDWIPVALESGKPYLGICLGAQLLARVLGATVKPHPDAWVEIGYFRVMPTGITAPTARERGKGEGGKVILEDLDSYQNRNSFNLQPLTRSESMPPYLDTVSVSSLRRSDSEQGDGQHPTKGESSLDVVDSELFSQPLQVYHWHREGFELPKGAVSLFAGDTFKNQAFRYGEKAYGLQFHPEMTRKMLEKWTTEGSHMLTLPGAQSRDEQLHQHSLHAPAMEHWLTGFLCHWLGHKAIDQRACA